IELLKKNLGKELGLKKCYQDAQVTDVVAQLTKLGQNNNFGAFQFAYISKDKNCKIVLSGPPPTVLDVDPSCTPDKITDLLIPTNRK
ncbi:hypothetical protein KKF84_21275, partial [Myxococcota bacterium]|nr:hypothetical protein [Myxococcota bacterium]